MLLSGRTLSRYTAALKMIDKVVGLFTSVKVELQDDVESKKEKVNQK